MLVSIVIPVYNRAQVVQRTLQSVLKQTHRPLQVILVDNCSTDNTLDVLNDFKAEHNAEDFSVEVVQEAHHTASAARNRGLEEAQGEWLVFFDSDDEMLPDLVTKYVEKIEQNPEKEVDMIGIRCTFRKANGDTCHTPFFTHDALANHILHSIFSTQRYAVKRSFFVSSGGWNKDIMAWDDWEIALRLVLRKPKIDFITTEPLVIIHDSGENSITGTDFSHRHGEWEHVIDVMCNNVRKSSIDNAQRYLNLLDYRRVVLAAHYDREGAPEYARELYATAYGRLKQHFVLKLAIPWLYWRIKHGRRGSARIAKLLIK